MPTGFNDIPGWFSWENQGAGLAVVNLDGSGREDLIVLMVDNPPGKNRGLYKVGKGLDRNGIVSGGWGDWIEVPDWFSWENQGAGIAVADLDGNGRPDLVVFMIDNPPGQNQGLYKVGKNLDSDGVVRGGWGAWIPIPDWFSWENQYGNITIADLDGSGRPDLVVFMIDHPLRGLNRGVYWV